MNRILTGNPVLVNSDLELLSFHKTCLFKIFHDSPQSFLVHFKAFVTFKHTFNFLSKFDFRYMPPLRFLDHVKNENVHVDSLNSQVSSRGAHLRGSDATLDESD